PNQDSLITREYWLKQQELGKDGLAAKNSRKFGIRGVSQNQQYDRNSQNNRDISLSERPPYQPTSPEQPYERPDRQQDRRNGGIRNEQDSDWESTGEQNPNDRGSVGNRTRRQSAGELRLRNDIKRTAPDINWD